MPTLQAALSATPTRKIPPGRGGRTTKPGPSQDRRGLSTRHQQSALRLQVLWPRQGGPPTASRGQRPLHETDFVQLHSLRRMLRTCSQRSTSLLKVRHQRRLRKPRLPSESIGHLSPVPLFHGDMQKLNACLPADQSRESRDIEARARRAHWMRSHLHGLRNTFER